LAQSKIEWTEAVWNPVTGCTKVSAGCKNCYAETIAKRFWDERKFTDVICHQDRLGQPLRWKKPRMIFVNSMSDLFHEDVPFEFIRLVFGIMYSVQQHTFQILTKRPERMLEFMERENSVLGIAKNIWLGVSVENQKTADERIPELLRIPTVVRWISAEPLLGEIDLTKYLFKDRRFDENKRGWGNIDWVVVGGESGPKARECNLKWIEFIVDTCHFNNVPVFVKQLGSKPYWTGKDFYVPTVKAAGIQGKNNTIENFPTTVAFREYPKV